MANESEILKGYGDQNSRLGNISTISDAHKLIHEGRYYYTIQRVTGSAAVRSQLIKTGTKSVHIKVSFSSGAGTPVELYESPTVTTLGVALARRNYNRTFSDNNTSALFYHTPTFTGGESIRPNQAGFGSTPGQARSGSTAIDVEYVLKPNTDYVFTQSPSTSTDTVLIFDYYEV